MSAGLGGIKKFTFYFERRVNLPETREKGIIPALRVNHNAGYGSSTHVLLIII